MCEIVYRGDAEFAERIRYATTKSAGFDVVSQQDWVIKPDGVAALPTGLWINHCKHIDNPYHDYEYQVRPKSGLSFSTGLIIPNSPGTIDIDYPNEIKILLRNIGKYHEHIQKGQKIAQIVCVPIIRLREIPTNIVTRTGGFGSTDKE